MNITKFKEGDIVWIRHSGNYSSGSDNIPRFIVYTHYGDKDKVSCQRFTYSKFHDLYDKIYSHSEEVANKIAEILNKRFGKNWLLDLHETYLFDPDQLELLYREEEVKP